MTIKSRLHAPTAEEAWVQEVLKFVFEKTFGIY